MERWISRSARSLVLAGAALISQNAGAQPPPPANSSSAMSNPSVYANPYVNPYMNPFMNPYMTQTNVPGNAMFYMFAAQQANGGIGSGRISGTRPAPAAPAAPAGTKEKRASDVPGAGASRYFNRAQSGAATTPANYYNRQGRFYSANHQ